MNHDATARAVISEARRWIGTPYRHQASLRGVGTDCLGLVRGVWRALYQVEPEATGPYSPNWAETGRKERLAEAAGRYMTPVPTGEQQPGDLLLFRWRKHLPAKHAAILSTPERMIHAHEGSSVCEVYLNAWWHRHLAFVFKFPEQDV